MKLHVPPAELSLTRSRYSSQNNTINCVLHAAPEDFPRFSSSGTPRLVLDSSRPTVVGWRWDQGHDPENLDGRNGSSSLYSLAFTYRPPGHSWGQALFAKAESAYRVEVEVDEEERTIWFPLPAGRSVHSLAEELGSSIYEWMLVQFISDWLFSHTPDTCEFSVDFGQSMSTDRGFEVFFTNEDADDDEYKSMHIMIPKDLLQDPIANGSKNLADGFNPWNEEQKSKIIAFLDPFLPRLTSFFETTAHSDRESQSYASRVWEDGLMTYVPAAESLR